MGPPVGWATGSATSASAALVLVARRAVGRLRMPYGMERRRTAVTVIHPGDAL